MAPVYMFGPHVNRDQAAARRPLPDHIEAARRAAKREGIEVTAVAFFLANPKTGKIAMDDSAKADLKAYLHDTKITAIVHAAYPVPWAGNHYAARLLRTEMEACAAAGAAGLVVHLPNTGPKAVCDHLAWMWPHHSKGERVRIYLETPAVSPAKSFYETPAKLAALFQAIRRSKDPRLAYTGLCIDTAHLWSCGQDISSYKNAAAWLADLETRHHVIPPSHIMLHLNDSTYACGDGKDEHAPLLHGNIWGKYIKNPAKSGLVAFLEYAVRHGTVVILERKPPAKLLGDYRVLHSLLQA